MQIIEKNLKIKKSENKKLIIYDFLNHNFIKSHRYKFLPPTTEQDDMNKVLFGKISRSDILYDKTSFLLRY